MTTTASSSTQATDLIFTYTFDYPQYLFNEKQQVLLMNTIQAPQFESEARTSRAPIDIVCVIDKSGSMEGGKIELVKKTLAFMIEQLKAGDRISIVAFDTDVSTDLPLTSMNEDGKKKAKAAVGNLSAGTSTNLSGGLFQGFEVVDSRTTKSDVVSVLLFTDGLANHGLTNTQQIVAGIHSYYQKIGTPCSLFTFGFGSDHDANMLRAIAEAGNGLYYFIEKEEEIPESFANCLGGLLSVVAQNIKVTITTAEGVRIVKFLSQYKKNELQKETKYEVLVGDLYSEEKRDMILELELPAVPQRQSNAPVATVQLSYFNVVTTSPQSAQLSCNVERVESVTPGLQVSLELDKQKNRIISANALETGRGLADKSQLEEARKVINEAIAKIEASPSGKDAYCVGLVADLRDCLVNMQDRVSYTSVGSKMMNNYWASNVYQRQTSSKSSAQQSYATRSKKMMSEASATVFKK